MTRSDVRADGVDLVDRDDDRHIRRLGVRDRFQRLRLDAVIGGDNEHRDIGRARPTGPHGGKRLVAGGIEEGNLPPLHLDLIGADALGDAARLAFRDFGLADRVEQLGLAVIDVPHDRDDRRARVRAAGRRAGIDGGR